MVRGKQLVKFMLVDGFFHKNALMLDDKPTLLDTPHIQGFKIFSLNGAMCPRNHALDFVSRTLILAFSPRMVLDV